MPKINNSQVIQKLVDELKLYPGKDVIPSELAEKILPVFQINSDEVSVSTTKANVVAGSTGAHNNSSVTIYTVPSTGKFFLTNCQLSGNSTSASGIISMTVVPKDGAATNILVAPCYGSAVGNTPQSTSFNLQNPMELEPGSVIQSVSGAAAVYVTGSIVGYTE